LFVEIVLYLLALCLMFVLFFNIVVLNQVVS